MLNTGSDCKLPRIYSAGKSQLRIYPLETSIRRVSKATSYPILSNNLIC